MHRILAVILTGFQNVSGKNIHLFGTWRVLGVVHMKMKAINLPLLALFGLCYGLGHPSLAAIRPALVDKTLASFHTDFNRTVVGWNERLKMGSSEAKEMATRPAAKAIVVATPSAAGAPEARSFAEPKRLAQAGFTVLAAR